MNTIQFDLINNAKDSLNHAVEHLTNPDGVDPGDIKLVIREVAHVVELLLKERLRQIHPAFIWQDVDKYQLDEANTVTTDKAIERLAKLAGISLNKEARKTILSCRKIRNSIEHYEFKIELKEAKGIIGRILSFIFDFSKIHLKLDLEKEFRSDDRWKELVDIYEFWEAHGEALARQLSDERKPSCECPSCGAGTFDLSIMECILCGHREEQIECDVCHESTWESEIEHFEGVDGDEESGASYYSINMCRACLDKERMAEMAADYMRDEYEHNH